MKLTKCIIPIVFLCSGCYTTKDINFVSKSRYPATEHKIDGGYYIIEEKEKPVIGNPYSSVEISEGSKYKYEVTRQYEKNKVISPGGNFMLGIGFSAIGGVICSNNPKWFNENTTSNNAFWGGALLTGLSWWLVAVCFPKERTKKVERPGYEFDYKPDELLKNTEITVKCDKVQKSLLTSDKGLIRFSPSFDFNINELKSNDSLKFIFSKGNKEFVKPLSLLPSNWMEQYVKIIVPKTTITNLKEDIGLAREGMLYKFITKYNGKLNIMLGSKSGWINEKDAEVCYTLNTRYDLSQAIKNYVLEEMQNWMKQGEFELPEIYLQRISKKDEQLSVFTNQAMKTFQKEYVDMFDWNKSTISNYDPNSQTFKVNIPELKEIVINVPISYAKKFKDNWYSNIFKNQAFTMIDGRWELVSLEIDDTNQSYVAQYNSKVNNNYDPVNQFAFDIKGFEPDLSKFNVKPENKLVRNEPDSEKYSINTNLPKTNMQQPDAIAIVIGNSFYQKIDPADFAINDAQLMKLYLTEVLGFKEGNIVFEMNTGKAQLEGLFGTDSNFKGKLYNYIKPEISDVFIFYSGHGAPDPETGEPYIVPSDCDPSYLNLQGYALKTLYSNLAKLPAKSTTIIIDACFSGAGVLKNLSSVRIKPKNTENDIPNSAILNSSGGEQVSSWYKEMKHGLFTYFFLKAIHDYKNCDKNGDKQLTFKEIYDYISDKTNGVPYFARRLNAVDQVPILKGSNTDRVFIRYN